MAESETYAHLEHLRHAGRADRIEENGQLYYELTGKIPPSGVRLLSREELDRQVNEFVKP